MNEFKFCKWCGNVFYRMSNNKNNWQLKKYCSLKCDAKFNHHISYQRLKQQKLPYSPIKKRMNNMKVYAITLFKNGRTLKDIAKELGICDKSVKEIIGDELNILSKKCKYCNNLFYKKKVGGSFNKRITCGKTGCRKRYLSDIQKSYSKKGFFKIGNKYSKGEYLQKIKVFNPDKYKLLRETKRRDNLKHKSKKRDIENKRRKLSGLPLIRRGYQRELELLYYLKNIFYGKTIVVHDRHELFSDNRTFLELDFYIPELKLAFEYMGEQHYNKDVFDRLTKFKNNERAKGEYKSFEYQQYRDRIKKRLCRQKGINLIRIRYDEEISEQNVLSKLKYLKIPLEQKRIQSEEKKLEECKELLKDGKEEGLYDKNNL